jgi:hypothetical protein
MTLTTDCYARIQERNVDESRSATPHQRVLYAGGSSGFYGVRCEQLGVAVDRPTYNLGLHAGLGLRYLLDRALAEASAGDLLVVGLEWELYRGPRFGEYACDYLMSRRPEYVHAMSVRDYWQLILSAGPPRVMMGLFRRFVPASGVCDAGDSGSAVNAFGDRILNAAELALHSDPSERHAGVMPRWRPVPRDVERDIARFVTLSNQKGVRMVVTFPPMCVEGRPDAALCEAVSAGLRALWGRHGIPVVGRIEDSLFQPNEAFDTPYHLREPAALIHTQRLALALRASGMIP